MGGSLGPRGRGAGAGWCGWTIALCARRRWSKHLLDVEEVLEIFRRRQLHAKRSECEFGRQGLGFTGHRLSEDGVSGDPRKVQSVVEWATPTPWCEVRRSTGPANRSRRFVEGYSELAAPLMALGSPAARFARTPEAQASLDALKLALASAPVLRTFDQGWQGRAGSLTSAPRPATPVETSAPRPATPSDPGLVRDSPGILHVTPQGDAHPTPGRPEA